MKLTITTLVIVEEGQIQDIYHSLEDNQEKGLSGNHRPSKCRIWRRRRTTILFSTGNQRIL